MENEKMIELLYKLSDSRFLWIQRKEVSAWSAMLFLYAILWSTTSFIMNENSLIEQRSVYIVLILVFAICFVFFRFIHSQYTAIYYSLAYSNVIRSLIFGLCKKDNSSKLDKEINNYEDLKNYIRNETNSELSIEVQKFRGKLHPVKIVFYLWLPIVYRAFHKSKLILSTHEKAEAAIYSLIIITLVFYTISFANCFIS